jgi:hypothetical protein
MSWKPFSRDEVNRLTAKPQPPDVDTPRICPCCGQPSIRHYYHDFKSLKPVIGSCWFWCSICGKVSSFSGPSMQNEFAFDDPFGRLSDSEFQELEKQGLIDRLDLEWNNNVLPQRFTRK